MHPHQAGGECVVQWYGDHRVDSVRHSVLSMFPILYPRVPTRRSVRGRNALENAIADATRDHPYVQQQYSQALQQPKEEELRLTSDAAAHCAVNIVPFTGLGSGQTRKLLHTQDTPPLDPRHLIIHHVSQTTSGDRKKTTSRVTNLPQAASLLAGQSSQSPQERSSQPSLGPTTRVKRKRRSR